jgi:GT2 family glycosyltransferase
VPTWNAVERLPEALGALADQVDAVVAVDNGSQDGTADWLLRWQAESPAARVILERPRNDGYAAATNAGAERALALGADAVLLVNDDAVFGAGAVALLCAALGADATLAAVSAKMLYADRPDILNGTGGRWDAERALATLRGDGETDLAQYDQAQRADYPSGAASLIGANAWRDVGPMDETYYLYYEDVDWGLRARQRGWEIGFVAGAVVHHAGSAGTRAAPERRRYYNVRNRCAFAGRYAPARGRTWAAAATLVLLAKQPARWLSPARRADAEAVALGVWDRLLGRTGRSPRFG